MTANTQRIRARTPEELIGALERRSQRRIAGGLISLHRRGERSLGPLWKPALGAFGVMTALVACKVMAARRPEGRGHGPGFALHWLQLASLWRP